MKEFWDERYSVSEFVYGKQPNEYFSKKLDELKPGKLLLPAEGEGRNAIYAAKKGWQVTAIDFSSKAKEKALLLAEENNVGIEYIIIPVEEYNFPEDKFDAAALIFAHFSPYLRARIHNLVVKSLKPGGTLIIEAFNKKQINNNTGGPGDISMLYNIEELQNDFPDLNIKELKEYQIGLSEGKHHEGNADVIRLLAEKK